MNISRRAHLKSVAAILAASRYSAAAAEPDFDSYSDTEKEKFLLSAKIVSAVTIDHGVTKPVKLQMSLAGVTHAAQAQVVDKELPDFFGSDKTRVPMKDCWRYNICAYKMDRLLGLNMVTVTVQRPYLGKPAGMSWWVDNVMFEEVERVKKGINPPNPELLDRQRAVSRVFDELIINIDRNLSNLLITKNWNLALIDHTRSFTAYHGIRNTENLTRCSRRLLDALKGLTADSIAAAVGPHLTGPQRDAMLSRRSRIVEFFQERVREKGEENVLFD